MKNLVNWKLFFILSIVCTLTALMVLPYTLALTQAELEITPVLLLLTVAQNFVLFAIAAFLGLFFSKRTGMGLPIAEGILEGRNQSKEFKAILLPSVCLGLLSGAAIVLASIPFNYFIPELQLSGTSVAAWKALLASFYGGIAEEVLLRLFIVSLLVWITFKIKKNKDGGPTVFGIWLSIFLASILFGLGHLPATAQIVPLTGMVIARAVILNGIGGIIFGWLYWKKGLESAILAHFTADIVLHIITPFVASFFS